MSTTNPLPKYSSSQLRDFAQLLLERAGLFSEAASDTARILLDGDLMGHSTHGLALLAGYLGELDGGRMARMGSYEVLSRSTATQTWDGARLPGPWLTLRACEAAASMAVQAGTGTVVIRRSHHIAALATYVRIWAERGYLALVYCSDPNTKSVAPFGGVTPVFTPNPFAAGIPTSGQPVILDISASYTTNGLVDRLNKAGQKLPHRWVQDSDGTPTDDPGVLFREPRGTLLPLGGLEAGHKGFALGILVEALTGGLAGFGRADPPEGWGATVMVQLFNLDAFADRSLVTRQTDFLVDACRAAEPRPDGPTVRMPGDRAQAFYREQLQAGVALHPTILPALKTWADRFDVAVPAAVS